MRFVEPKSEQLQARPMLFRGLERLVRQRTKVINALCSNLYECGYVVPQGLTQLNRIVAFVADPDNALPDLAREKCRTLIGQIVEKTPRIAARMKKIKALAIETETARRLQTMPGIGPLIAMAIEAFAPDMKNFRSGRDFAAWLGLVSRQHSCRGKERLGRVAKAGQLDMHRLLIKWSNVAPQLDRAQVHTRRIVVGAHARPQTADAGGGCPCQQDGMSDLGHTEKG